MEFSIPVIDITSSILTENRDTLSKDSQVFGEAFEQYGFVYVIGHGLKTQYISNIFKTSKQFFVQENKKKNIFRMEGYAVLEKFGYVSNSMEVFSKNKKLDSKEAFDFMPIMKTCKKFQSDVAFLNEFDHLFAGFKGITIHLLKLLSIYIFNNENVLPLLHNGIGKQNNITTLRSLYYPVVHDLNQRTWCSEHKDYGSITLLVQDENGGLEVLAPSGQYIPVNPLENSIVVNAADLLEILTAGKIRSVLHRVTPCGNNARQSVAYFCQPNNDVIVKPLVPGTSDDIQQKYNSVNTLDYLQSKIAGTWRSDK